MCVICMVQRDVGGPDDFGAWELTATPLKQLRVRSFKDCDCSVFRGVPAASI